MKQITAITALLLISMISSAQNKYTLTSGTNGYVTITAPGALPQDYTRGSLATLFAVRKAGDTTMQISFTDGFGFNPLNVATNDTNYLNGDDGGGKFPTYDSLNHWVRNHLNKYE